MLVALFFLFTISAFAQNSPEYFKFEEDHKEKPRRASAVLYHTYIGTTTAEGTKMLVVPSLGLDVEYWFSKKWGIGSHNDIELISFEVHREKDRYLKRETPVLLTLDALWKPWKGLVFLAGPGIELETEKDLFVLRAGLEYEIEIGSHWDLAPTIFYDNRSGAYDTFSVGIGIGKRF